MQPSVRGRNPSHTYRKMRLSADAKIIIELLKKQPQTAKEIYENVKIDKSTFYRVITMLKEVKIQVDHEREVDFIKEVDGGYALWFYEPMEKKIEETLLKLVNEKRLPIHADFLASEVGKPWSEIEGATYTVIKKLELIIETTEKGEIMIRRKTTPRLLRAY